MASAGTDVEKITGLLNDFLPKQGFEVHPLKVAWYNSVLEPSMRINYPEDTVAAVVLSTPDMFEQAFLPFLEQSGCQRFSDPIDQCVKHSITSAVSQKVDISYDYEMLPTKLPKFLAQTAAHMAGAAYYYRQDDVIDQPWGKKKMYGVCIHPRFGGWFAIRALLVFDGVVAGPELVQPVPIDCVSSREDRIQLLEAFNLRWQDGSYRDIIPVDQTYSQRQQDYFLLRPAKRFDLLRSWGFDIPEDEDEPNAGSDEETKVGGHG
ncbi:cyanocobalamin reductase / alkylcobalamin dealkylase isoform X2 [Genypterus blacodes]|uniref:cyanocobalamin reductase / alkylcobalamin dealkylase isoform X2 n=1 Tax=Genypterus blacodes TaxID=154954 RepID=UPI003F769B9B